MKILTIIALLTCYLFGASFNIDNLKDFQGKDENKVIYKDMLNYLKKSKDSNFMIVLGSLYATGTDIKDDNGEIIEKDHILAQEYLMKAIKAGNVRALTVLGSFYYLNKTMRVLDKDLSKSEKFLRLGFENNDKKADSVLVDLLFFKNKENEAINILIQSSNKHNPESQMRLAILFKAGLMNKDKKIVISKNDILADTYLNLACTNKNEMEKVREICLNGKYVELKDY